mmetsp:Transcript_11519/g.32407  ORF Transcript_11519/g.32407 Transcript_11519/m.32407 type:complete len:271 (-) Transcript_11519:504-1316(-)
MLRRPLGRVAPELHAVACSPHVSEQVERGAVPGNELADTLQFAIPQECQSTAVSIQKHTHNVALHDVIKGLDCLLVHVQGWLRLGAVHPVPAAVAPALEVPAGDTHARLRGVCGYAAPLLAAQALQRKLEEMRPPPHGVSRDDVAATDKVSRWEVDHSLIDFQEVTLRVSTCVPHAHGWDEDRLFLLLLLLLLVLFLSCSLCLQPCLLCQPRYLFSGLPLFLLVLPLLLLLLPCSLLLLSLPPLGLLLLNPLPLRLLLLLSLGLFLSCGL